MTSDNAFDSAFETVIATALGGNWRCFQHGVMWLILHDFAKCEYEFATFRTFLLSSHCHFIRELRKGKQSDKKRNVFVFIFISSLLSLFQEKIGILRKRNDV